MNDPALPSGQPATETRPESARSASSPQHLIGLDLVFTGASGYGVFEYPGDRLAEHGLLDPGGQGSSRVADKIARGQGLYDRLARLALTYRRSVWVIEVSDWVKKEMPQRERETLKSLALARGLAVGAALIWQTAIPVCMGAVETRSMVVGARAAKRAQFDYLRHRYQLTDLQPVTEDMNITDAIALATAFAKVYHQPSFAEQWRDVIGCRLAEAVSAFQRHSARVGEQLGERGALRGMGGTHRVFPDIDLKALALEKGLTSEYRKDPAARGERWASYDISATHPGVVVYDRLPDGIPQIAFHHTFALERPQPDRRKAQSAYEIGVASNILRSLAILKAALGIEGVVFEYSDWHRAGSGSEFYIDRIAIDSLFFSYGVLMAGAYHLGLPMLGVNATEAKAEVAGKKNAGKAEMEAAVQPLYPFLKNEHTRDAAALMLTVHGGPLPSPAAPKRKMRKQGEDEKKEAGATAAAEKKSRKSAARPKSGRKPAQPARRGRGRTPTRKK